MVSERKLAANRQNAKRSTGPKTPEGKAAVRYNALKHGLLALEVVIPSGDGQEDREEFELLLSSLADELQPVGVLEESRVERIAVCLWRLRRAARFESAEIRRSYGVPESECPPPEVPRPSPLDSVAGLNLLAGGGSSFLQNSSSGIDKLLKLVADARLALQVNGHLPESDRNRLLEAYGREDGSVGHTCFASNYWITDRDTIEEEDPQKAADGPTPEECKVYILFTLDAERRRLLSLRRRVAKREAAERERQALQRDLDRACLALPPEDATNRLLRYETAIERQLYRAMAELERLQRRRRTAAATLPLAREASPN